MTAIKSGDLVVVTGPLKLGGDHGRFVDLTPGEVGLVLATHFSKNEDLDVVRVRGRESGALQWINRSSLTPLSEIQWGAEGDSVV